MQVNLKRKLIGKSFKFMLGGIQYKYIFHNPKPKTNGQLNV
jgi:hypothetical protein